MEGNAFYYVIDNYISYDIKQVKVVIINDGFKYQRIQR